MLESTLPGMAPPLEGARSQGACVPAARSEHLSLAQVSADLDNLFRINVNNLSVDLLLILMPISRIIDP